MPSMPPHPSLLGMGPGPPRPQSSQPQFYNARSYGQQAGGGGSANGSLGGRGGHRSNRGSSSGAAPDRYLMANAGPDFHASLADPTSRGSGINGSNSRRLKQIFNEKTFRKQMTGRGMSQLQLSNFPPFLKLDSLEPIDAESYNELKNKGMHLIETNQPEKYSRLRWTVLKDYIKLKCPRLLSLQQEKSASVQPQDGSGAVTQDSQNPARENNNNNNNNNTGNNTREFYVGVYEDHEEPMDLKITPLDSSDPSREPQYGVASATVYKAIVGFNSKELCDRCMEALRGQEYSLGYHLEVRELPPYEEEQRAV
ncbi:uncharacterized protein ZBAI_00134 [Zygosaccharomyces bailii ISA1307]|nr:uncharacterized protein ZBAI_00134 [Zygosaccharomyces bailii ISA1307]